MTFSQGTYFGSIDQEKHSIIYNDWGDKASPVIICVHGLTGNGSDFGYIAPALVALGYRVIAVDLPGRGASDFLKDPQNYTYAQYIKDLFLLLDHLGLNTPASVDWLGVSLGGLLGIYIAGMKNTPIKRLILNDVGPSVPKPVLDFIHQVISQTYHFENIDALEQTMRQTRGLTWGPMADEQWAFMAKHNARTLDDGTITYSYDPNIATVFKDNPIGDVDLWPFWDDISLPVLLLRGKKSLVLTKKIVKQMKKRKVGAAMDFHVFNDCGHVPSLMAPDQIAVITDWLGIQN